MTKTYKRALSNAQAAACENAKHPKCRCRCQGTLHGKGHASYQAQERELLDQQKELTSEQIPEIIKSLPTDLASVKATFKEREPAKPATHDNGDNPVNHDNHDNHANPGARRQWSTINRDNEKIAVQGWLPLEVR